MALAKAKRSEIPAGSVILTENEALQYQADMLSKWRKTSDVFAFKYGASILAVISGGVGAYLNSHYRMKLKLRSYGLMSSYLPCIGIPALASYIFHCEFVIPDVILPKNCPVCVEIRSSSIQAMTGCLLPVAFAPLPSFALASQYLTYNLPFITKEPRKVFELWRAKTKPIGNILFAILVAQAFIASVVTYYEAKSVRTCNEKMHQIELAREQMKELM